MLWPAKLSLLATIARHRNAGLRAKPHTWMGSVPRRVGLLWHDEAQVHLGVPQVKLIPLGDIHRAKDWMPCPSR